MRYLFVVTMLILLIAVPWLMYNPEQADFVFSHIQRIGDSLAAVILSHMPKSIIDIKSRYDDKPGIFASAGSAKKVRILLVPGHEPDQGGAEYGSLKERNMNVELASYLKQFLEENDRYEVTITRSRIAWNQTFANYFQKEWNNIIEWQKAYKDETINLTRLGEFHPAMPVVFHNKAPADVAYRLYGIGKWSNENDTDIIIHVHFNDYPGHSASSPGKYSGFTIYVPQKDYLNSTTTKALADAVFKRLAKYSAVSNLPGESTGVVEDQDLIAVGAYNSLNAASMLIEYGYIYEPQFTNPNIRTAAEKDLAFQTYLGLQDFFDDHNVANIDSFDTLVIPHSWGSTMTENETNNYDIFALQTALLFDGEYPPEGKSLNDCPRTGKIGNCTKTALDAFQKRYGIKGEKGIVGTKTLEELNKLYSVKAI